MEIRAITVYQPWASLLGAPIGHTKAGRPRFAKNYETRPWATEYRGELAIHAAAKPIHETLRLITDYAQLRAICEALIPIIWKRPTPPGVISWQDVAADLEHVCAALPRRAVICVGELKACHLITEELLEKIPLRERLVGDWTPGRYAWEIVKRRPQPPITVNGAQGLWRWR